MKLLKPYYLLLVPVLLALASCGGNAKKINKRITLWRNDKIPYGTWYAYNNIKDIFPQAEVIINRRSPDKYRQYTSSRNAKNLVEDSKYDGLKTAYIIISTQVYPDENEIQALLTQVGSGEAVFISSLSISEKLLDTLHLKTAYYNGYFKDDDSLTISVQNPVTSQESSYTYPGMALDNYFSDMDTTITTVLGRDEAGHPNFVQFTYNGGGSLYIHLAPVAFTNFFLLHKNNKAYYDNALSHLPHNVQLVRWDDYFRYSTNGDGGDGDSMNSGYSAVSWLMKQPALATALWLLLILLLIIYLFESKRKQRAIPVVEQLKNSSLDFVKTIGRLYFQRKDNKDLAHKMTAYFMDYVRNRYNIKTSLYDEEFEKRLAWKSGYDPEAIKNMLYYLKFTQDQPYISDEELLRLNIKLDNFYKHT